MKFSKSVWRTSMLITQLGISIMVPIFMCVLLGSFLQEKTGLPLFLPCLVLGVLAGGRSVYKIVMGFIKMSEQDNHRDSHM